MGAELAVDFSKNLHGEILAATLGVEMILRVIQLGEELLPRHQSMSTHPKAAQRLENIHVWLQREYGIGAIERIKSIGRFFEMTAWIGKAFLAEMAPKA